MKKFGIILVSCLMISCGDSESESVVNQSQDITGTWKSAGCIIRSFSGYQSRTSTYTYSGGYLNFETKLYTDTSCTQNELLSLGTRQIIIGNVVTTTNGLDATEIDELIIGTDLGFYGLYRIEGGRLYFSNYSASPDTRPNTLDRDEYFVRVN